MSDIESSVSDSHDVEQALEDVETADEKRLRLAKEYLADIKKDDDDDEDDDDGERVAKRLRKDVEVHAKRNRESIASTTRWKEPTFYRGHKLPVTCVSVSPQDPSVVFTGGKDCVTIKWDLPTGKKVKFPGFRKEFNTGGHFDQIFAVCAIDSNTVISAGKDHLVRVWDTRDGFTPKCQDVFRGHRSAITCIRANPDSQELYTGSWDKTVRIWNLQTRSYVDSLFGHSDEVNDMDILANSKPVTCGADKTLRLWKVQNDTHLVFQGHHTASVDSCAVVDNEMMVSGSQDGSIAVWSQTSKKPVARVENAHNGAWLSSLGSVYNTDLLYSGAEGGINAWKVERVGKKEAQLSMVRSFDCTKGTVNAIRATKDVCVAAVSKEHKFGRWNPCKAAANGIVVIPSTNEPEEI